MPRSISSALRTPIGVDGATVWIAASPPEPAGTLGSRLTATRVPRGAISLSSSSHFPLMLNSYVAKPVAFPPGRARLSTQPPPTGSMVVTNTIGTVRLTCCSAPTIEPAVATMTSGESATNSAAYLRKRSRSPAPQRYSMRTLPPIVQPRSWSPCAKADIQASALGSSGLWLMSTPMRLIRAGCCARAASGHAAAAPITVMNSRRLMLFSPRGSPDQAKCSLDDTTSHHLEAACRSNLSGRPAAGARPSPPAPRSGHPRCWQRSDNRARDSATALYDRQSAHGRNGADRCCWRCVRANSAARAVRRRGRACAGRSRLRDETRPARPARSSTLGVLLELPLQGFERYASSAARKAPMRQVIILNVLDLAQNRLPRVVALAAASFLGQRVEPLLDLGRQTKGKHFGASRLLYMYSDPRLQSNWLGLAALSSRGRLRGNGRERPDRPRAAIRTAILATLGTLIRSPRRRGRAMSPAHRGRALSQSSD